MTTDTTPKTTESELARWLDAMDLAHKLNSPSMSEEDAKAAVELKGTLLRALDAGSLSIDAEGRAMFAPTKGDSAPLTFNEPTGADLQQMDRAARGHNIERQNLFLAAITKAPVARFEKMAARDYRVAAAIMTAFLA
jgi:hypothetical protein